MRTNQNIISMTAVLGMLMASCSDQWTNGDEAAGDRSPELNLTAKIDQINESRADDSGFADGDRIGIFVVNYSGDQPGQLLTEGNQATNVRFTFDEKSFSWKGDRPIYFKDNDTKADVYGVYPYTSNISDVEKFPFSVEINQSEKPDNTLGHYEASDLLWGKAEAVSPSNPLVTVFFKHILSGVTATLLEGEGFDDGEWAMLDKSVFIGGTVRGAEVNLSTGKVSPSGEYDGRYITANPGVSDFRAVVVPQSVAATTPLIIINVGDKTYKLTKEETMTYSPSKLHKFTIQVNKDKSTGDFEFTLVQEAITPWESDLQSHSGELKEYLTVNVAEFGGLEEALKSGGMTPANITNLKISGKMDADDFRYLRENLVNLEALNISEVTVRGKIWDFIEHINDWEIQMEEKYNDKNYTLPYDACNGMKYLRYVVFPSKLRAIGNHAFVNTSISGSLLLPEGLEFIGGECFSAYMVSLRGELRLPSTLKYIWTGAFSETDFSGELVLPAGVVYIGDRAFNRCQYLEGKLHIPENVEYIGTDAFYRVLGLTGEIIYPHSETIVRPIAGDTGIDAVRLPEAPVEIRERTFNGVPLRGDLTVPSSVKKIGNGAFANTKLSHIYFPKGLDIDIINENLLSNNQFLIDTIAFPDKVEFIEAYAVSNCGMLDAIVLPKNIVKIGEGAFSGCSSLTYLRCNAPEPPEVTESAFSGINKDNFTIEVPEQSVNAYRTHPVWGEFKRIAAYKNFVARPLKYNVLNKGGVREIVLNADAEWEVESIPSWCSLDKMSGNRKTTLTLTISPMSHNTGNREEKIVFRLKGDNSYTTSVTVGQYDYEYEEDETITLQRATKGKGINLYFVGDGFDAIDISDGSYIAAMKEEVEYLFAVEPYATYRDYFNIYCGFALSEESGVEDVNHWRKTKFHTVISNTDTRLETNWVDAFNYAADVADQCDPVIKDNIGVVLVVNSPIYEGITYSDTGSDSYCAVVTRSQYDFPNDARGIIQHEVGGHGIGWLGDEYRYHNSFIQNCPCICCSHVDQLNDDHSHGYALNLSLNGKFKQVPWYHLMKHPDYSDIVDIYEGGYFHAKGVFRSEYNTCMNNNVPYFSTWSRQLIVQRIMKMAGEEFALEKFYAYDKCESGGMYHTRGLEATTAPVKHGRPPVRVNDLKLGRKGGRK